jgi:hypothetical protein
MDGLRPTIDLGIAAHEQSASPRAIAGGNSI